MQRGAPAARPKPIPGKGPWPCRALLPLHCSRWETSSAALLSLQGSRPWARSFLIWRVKRYLWRGTGASLGELGAGLGHEGHGCSQISWDAHPQGHRMRMQPLQLGTGRTGTSLSVKCSLVDFKINIPFCFGGHLPLLGLMFCISTVLILFLVPVCNAFSKIIEANNVIFKNKTKVVLSEHCLRQELD